MQGSSEDRGEPLNSESADRIRKEAIAVALAPFTAEMKLVDVIDLVAYVRTEKHANISDLIKSSAELFFKEGTLRYGMGANVELDWDTTPTIGLDLEFFNMGVWVYLTLILSSPDNALNVAYIEFTGSNADDEEEDNTQRLLTALQDSRL
ncbi:hypothetical protein [Roseibium polysiphoniae]|uniref:Uncharacterized protein n=1 Tax=Roseibium polysiphoniae TaxID=2571221 RepID=A0A944GT32_9HYPH|nr:hypothetical protein [Roseibium polysiphoniae]MBD8877039.1 hypothetical protein [Roseibium polysiphoniae]MBS8260782.1 hypothetical protein [Roseibium polysiphoniae]